MSTPRTEAKTSGVIGFWSCATVPSEFARELERENNILKYEQRGIIAKLERDNAKLRTALKELRRWVADGDCSDDVGIWPGYTTQAYRDVVAQADEALGLSNTTIRDGGTAAPDHK